MDLIDIITSKLSKNKWPISCTWLCKIGNYGRRWSDPGRNCFEPLSHGVSSQQTIASGGLGNNNEQDIILETITLCSQRSEVGK